MSIRRLLPPTLTLLAVLASITLSHQAAAQEALRPAQGMFLVASRQIKDPRFRQSVVLLLSVEPTGAVGLIINKPSGMKLSSLFSDMRKTSEKRDRLYFGGPVETRKALILFRSRRPPGLTQPVLRNVSVSTNGDFIRQALRKNRAGKDYKLFMGYAGWGAGQLDREIRRGGWYVLRADDETVFKEDETKIWPALIRKGEEILVWERQVDIWLADTARLLLHPD